MGVGAGSHGIHAALWQRLPPGSRLMQGWKGKHDHLLVHTCTIASLNGSYAGMGCKLSP